MLGRPSRRDRVLRPRRPPMDAGAAHSPPSSVLGRPPAHAEPGGWPPPLIPPPRCQPRRQLPPCPYRAHPSLGTRLPPLQPRLKPPWALRLLPRRTAVLAGKPNGGLSPWWRPSTPFPTRSESSSGTSTAFAKRCTATMAPTPLSAPWLTTSRNAFSGLTLAWTTWRFMSCPGRAAAPDNRLRRPAAGHTAPPALRRAPARPPRTALRHAGPRLPPPAVLRRDLPPMPAPRGASLAPAGAGVPCAAA